MNTIRKRDTTCMAVVGTLQEFVRDATKVPLNRIERHRERCVQSDRKAGAPVSMCCLLPAVRCFTPATEQDAEQ